MTTLTMASIIESYFQQYLITQRRVSIATIHAYRDTLRLLLLFAARQQHVRVEQLTVQVLDRDLVLAFLEDLEQTRHNSIRTRNLRRAAIRSFFRYMAYMDPMALAISQRVLAIPSKHAIHPVLGYLTQDELRLLLNALDRAKRLDRRDYTLLLFLARTGARVSEAIAVNADDLCLQHPCQVILHGKGGRDRLVPLAHDLVMALREYETEYALATHTKTAVFVNVIGHRLTRRGVTHVVQRAVALASKNHPQFATRAISPHTFRHTVAMHLLQSGVDLNVIRAWLGHVNINTTHLYIEADIEMKRRALEQCGVIQPSEGIYKPSDSILAILESL